MSYQFFIINPGSTSTKVAVYEDDREILSKNIEHSPDILAKYDKVFDQFDYRLEMIEETVREQGIDLSKFTAILARGGNMKPVTGGTYLVNDEMVEDLKLGVMGQHPNNMGGCLARKLADENGLKAYVVDPVIVDEFEPVSRISGSPLIKRKSKDHPLNQKAVARAAAESMGKRYDEINAIVVHMGGGVSVGIHKKGKLVDVNNSLDGDGPMSPNRPGGLPFGAVVDLCFSGKYTKEQLMKTFVGGSGLFGYLGTMDAREVVSRIESGDKKAKLVYEAMAYQIAKEIGAAAAALKGKVDCICLTGGLAYDELLTGWIREYTEFIAPIKLYPGEHEMLALARGVKRVLDGEEELMPYPNPAQIEY